MKVSPVVGEINRVTKVPVGGVASREGTKSWASCAGADGSGGHRSQVSLSRFRYSMYEML